MRRLKSEAGDVVYAFVHELEAWRDERTRLGDDPAAADECPADAEHSVEDVHYNWVNDLLVDGSTRQVPVIESEQLNMISFYTFSPDSNTVRSFTMADGAESVHQRLEATGVLDHPFRECPLRKHAEVRYADGLGGWRTEMIPAR